MHWVGVAVRESVINAIKHGNRERPRQARDRRVRARAGAPTRPSSSSASATRARASIPRRSPTRSRPRTCSSRAGAASSSCAASWTTSRCGARRRGRHGSAHGQEARAAGGLTPSPDPCCLATAIEAVLAPATCSWRTSASDVRVDKKGAIDLVTEVDLAVERDVPRHDRRAVSRSRRPRRGARAAASAATGVAPLLDLRSRSTARPTTRTACRSSAASLALEIDGVLDVGAIYDPTRHELFTAERGAGACLNGAPLRVSTADTLIDALLVHRLPLRRPERPRSIGPRAVRRVPQPGRAPSAGSARPRSTSATWPPAASTASGKQSSSPGTSPPARSSWTRRAGR